MKANSMIQYSLKDFRKRLKMSQEAFGAKVNKSQSTISKYETGQIVPTELTLDKIQKRFSFALYSELIFYGEDKLQNV